MNKNCTTSSYSKWPFLIIFTFTFVAWNSVMANTQLNYDDIGKIPQEKWLSLQKKKIFFGHQSVGLNIIDGIKKIISNNKQISFSIDETTDFQIKSNLFHYRVGNNRDPLSKINDFVKIITHDKNSGPNIAALKFCYVDFQGESNIGQIFENYNNSIERLKSEYPHISIIHFTVPLKSQEFSLKTRIKMLAGMQSWELNDNIKRNQYNQLLINKYKGKDLIFDIAEIESTKPNGERTSFTYKNSKYFYMFDGYTYDGGHLNDTGKEKVASKFLLFLINNFSI